MTQFKDTQQYTQIFSLWWHDYTGQFQLIIIIKSKAKYRIKPLIIKLNKTLRFQVNVNYHSYVTRFTLDRWC